MSQGYPQQRGGFDPGFGQEQGQQRPPRQYPPLHAQGRPYQPQMVENPPEMPFQPHMTYPSGAPLQQVPIILQPPPLMQYAEQMPPGAPQGVPPPGFTTVGLPPPPKDQPTAAKVRASKKFFNLGKDGSIVGIPAEERGVTLIKPPEEPLAQSRAGPSTHPPAPSSILPPVQQQAQPPSQPSVPPQAQPSVKAPPRILFDRQKIDEHDQQKKKKDAEAAPAVRSLTPEEKMKRIEVHDTQQSKPELDYFKQAKEIGEQTLGPDEGAQHKVYNSEFLDRMHELVASRAIQPAANWRSPGESASSALPERSSLGGAAKQKTPGRQVLEFGREGMKSPPIDKSAVKRSQSAWVPKRERKDEVEPGIEKTVKVFRRLLNKVTPTTYDELSEEFCEKRIYEGGEDLLRAVVDLIFEKAVDEVKYCPTYADLCHKQSERERKKQSGSGEFERAIIAKCQRTFEHGLDEDSDEDSNKQKPSEEEEDTEAVKARKKRKLVGTIELIAQLYMRSIVSCAVVAGCIAEVSTLYEKEREEAYVEYAVKMLETVGKKFHQDPDINERAGKTHTPAESWDKVYAYFLKMKHKMSSRVRFLVMNLEDLVRSNWDDEKRKAKGPRTMEQLEAEEREEELKRVQQREAFDRKQRGTRGLVYSHSNLGPSVYGTRRGLPHQGRDSQPRRPLVVTRHGTGFPPTTRPPSVSGTSYTGGSSRNPSPAASVHSMESQNRHQQDDRDRRLKKAEVASRTAGGGSAAPQVSLKEIGRSETMGLGRGSAFVTVRRVEQLRTTPWRNKEECSGDASKVERTEPALKTDGGGDAIKAEQSEPTPKTDEGGDAPKTDGGEDAP